MSFFSLENIQRATRGRWLAAPRAAIECTGVGTDTRAELTNRAFLALRGPNHDGHHHLHDAVAAGAKLLIVDRDEAAEKLRKQSAILLVENTRMALRDLAAAFRAQLRNTTVIAVTGSCGKTTTKELIHAVLATTMSGSRAPKSFNNDIGVPLTILTASPDDDYLVLELGMNHPGEIAALAQLARPNVAVITTIGPAHLGAFQSVQDIADEKATLLVSLPPDGVAIVNVDHEFSDRVTAPARSVLTFGASDSAAVRLTDYGRDDALDRWWFDVNDTVRFQLSLPGRHNAVNALAAVAMGRQFGLDDEVIARGIASVSAPAMRLSRAPCDGVEVFNDAHNANPQSMAASLEAFIESTAAASRRVLVLGDMLELGDAAAPFHTALGGQLLDCVEAGDVDLVFLIGPLMRHAAEVLRRQSDSWRVQWREKLDDRVVAEIWSATESGDAMLLKASRSMALERVIQDRSAARCPANAVA